MNTRSFHPFLLAVLLAGLGLMLASRAPAQICTSLHNFNGSTDGEEPLAGLIISGNTLYGTTWLGGALGVGTVFSINVNGSGFANLNVLFNGTNSYQPETRLVLVGNTLYGTTDYGGIYGGGFPSGAVFSIDTDGMNFVNRYSFIPNSSDGEESYGGLVFSGNTLYGTTHAQGAFDSGTVFSISTDGSEYINIYTFSAKSLTNSDGANPNGGLVLSGNTLYGTTTAGGTNNFGTVFRVNTDGSSFTNLHTFGSPGDGRNPLGSLVLSGNTLYGTAFNGTSSGFGAVFAVNTDGSGFTNLHVFDGVNGAYPAGSLTLSGKTLYGSASGGFEGTVFSINTDGSGFTNIYFFNNSTKKTGNDPNGGLVLSGNTLYGTTTAGGTNGYGVVFSLTVPITLFYQNISSAVVLTWNDPSFVLQAAPAVTGTYTNIPGATSPYTNTITGPQQFFRLLVSQ
jgi:uncharacterized repeat protein (TIGR03803 family)